MAVHFDVKDVLHKTIVRFARATLPGARKPYILRTARQEELDIHAVASKADVYNVSVDPRVIEEGLAAGLALIRYLVADGFRVKTPLFSVKINVPGGYEGTETTLPDDVLPEPRILPSEAFCDYIRRRVKVAIDGPLDADGCISKTVDEETGSISATATAGGILAIHGSGLKIQADDAHRAQTGLFFQLSDIDGGQASDSAWIPAKIMVNEPLILKALVPAGLQAGAAYTLVVVTQGSARGHGTLLHEARRIQSDFSLTILP